MKNSAACHTLLEGQLGGLDSTAVVLSASPARNSGVHILLAPEQCFVLPSRLLAERCRHLSSKFWVLMLALVLKAKVFGSAVQSMNDG